MNRIVVGGLFALILAVVVGSGTVYAADSDDRASVLRAQAHALASDGSCDQALPLLDQAASLDAGDQRANALAAQCLMRLGRYDEAEARLAAPLAAASVPTRARLDLVGVRYHQGNIDGASEALEAARPYHANEAEFQLYDGMILLDRGDYEAAARELQRARRNGADTVEPVASFHESLAWAHAREGEKEREALRRVTAYDPNSIWAERANRRLDGVGDSGSADLDRWFDITIGGEWDDNVVLNSSGVATNQDDARLVWSSRYGQEMFRTKDWSGGFELRYSGNSHRHVQEFNQHYPEGTLWLARRLNEQLVAQIQYDGGYAWLDNDSFVIPHSLSSSLFYRWQNGHETTLLGRAYWNNFIFTPGAPRTPPFAAGSTARDVNRDEKGAAVGFSHAVPVEAIRGMLSAGYLFYRNEAHGDEWDYFAHQPFVGFDSNLTDRTTIKGQASWAAKQYDNTSAYRTVIQSAAGPDRREYLWDATLSIDHAITNSLTGTVRYRYSDSDNDHEQIYDYDRNIAGVYLTYRFF